MFATTLRLGRRDAVPAGHRRRPFYALHMLMVALCAVGFTVAPIMQANAGTATVSIRILQASFLFGGSGGEGTITYQGRTQRIVVGGLSVGLQMGINSADITGTVYNLYQLSDINGVYFAAGAEGTLGAGRGVATLTNGHGVTLQLRSANMGLSYALNLSGISIKLR